MLKSWKTTLLGVLAGLTMWAPVLQGWLTANKDTHVGPVQILGLILALMGALAKDHNVTGT